MVICENCHEPTYKELAFLKGHEHHFCGRECANEYQARNKLEFVCKICGRSFYWSKSRVTQTNPTYCSVECRYADTEFMHRVAVEANLVQQHKRGLNRLELAGREILERLEVDFQEQVLIAKKFLVDVLISKCNLIIQWDGDYWHGHPRYEELSERQLRRKKLDASQDAYLTKCGYEVLRFWEADVKQSPRSIERQIAEALC